MSGGYTRAEIQLADALDRPEQRLLPAPSDRGIAVTLRDGDKFVGFSLHARAQLGANGLPFATLVTTQVREAVAYYRLRARLASTDLPAPKLTVAICSKDRPVWVARVLDSLLPLTAQMPAEILVVDNAPTDERTRDEVEARPPVRYIREPKAGLNFARNRALAEAGGKVLAFLDDDVVADGNYLRGLPASGPITPMPARSPAS